MDMEMDMAISRDELNKGILNLKKHKSSGTDGITNEMIIYGGEHLYGAILTIFNKILDTSIQYIQLTGIQTLLYLYLSQVAKTTQTTTEEYLYLVVLVNCSRK